MTSEKLSPLGNDIKDTVTVTEKLLSNLAQIPKIYRQQALNLLTDCLVSELGASTGESAEKIHNLLKTIETINSPSLSDV